MRRKMKTISAIGLAIILFFICPRVMAQVNGVVLLDSMNLKVVKVWGTHQQRGYAQGYLLAAEIHQMITGYIKPAFGSNYSSARSIITTTNDLYIDPKYVSEAQGIIEGMNAAGMNPDNLDVTDVVVSNSILDIQKLLGMKSSLGCSSFMNWGSATQGTSLNGKSVISRHLDWTSNATLLSNQVIMINQPSEPGEQKWLSIGFAGMISALSGVNSSLGTFQHMMSDFSGSCQHNMQYTPIWFALRDAVESVDYNNDGVCNVQDVRSSLLASPNGFANGYLISALANNNTVDSLVAMVAELAPVAPKLTFRYNNYADSIPGSNLYAANYQIARNNLMHFCTRYNGIRSHIGNGTGFGLAENWNMMRDYSHQSNNIQFMQFSPEAAHLQIAVKTTVPAYLEDSIVFNLTQLLNDNTGLEGVLSNTPVRVFPNPVNDNFVVEIDKSIQKPGFISVYDLAGKLVYCDDFEPSTGKVTIPLGGKSKGVYLLKLHSGGKEFQVKVVR